MPNKYSIDTTYDVRTDSGGGDPDSHSSILRKYHKILWSKPLPSGKMFNLDDTIENVYLSHSSDMGNFILASDSIIHTYFKWQRMQHIILEIPKDDIDYFYNIAHTVGGYNIFPGNRINGLNTINQARGLNYAVSDRMDLTLECIRRFYIDESSPLSDTLERYSDFFNLFLNFQGYCEFFLLQDLVTSDFSSVKFYLPFSEFKGNPLPKNVSEYIDYMQNNISFIIGRNDRMLKFSTTLNR